MVNSMGGGTDNESGRGKQMDTARRENSRFKETPNRTSEKSQDRRDWGSGKLASASKAAQTNARVHAPKGMR